MGLGLWILHKILKDDWNIFTFISAVRSFFIFFYINIFIFCSVALDFRMNYLRQLLGTTHHIWDFWGKNKNKKRVECQKFSNIKKIVRNKESHSTIWFICLVFFSFDVLFTVLKSNKIQQRIEEYIFWMGHLNWRFQR